MTQQELVSALRANPFVLAPMAGITDVAFRSFMKEMGVGIVISELISANGLEYASQRTRDLMKFEDFQRPVGIQLFGETPEIVARGARYVQDQGADFVDLNFGCPVPKVVKKGAGSALLKDLPALRDMVRAVRAAIEIPLTIKIRTGWDEKSRNAEETLKVAFDEGVSWVAIHGRTRAQGYSGDADWNYISEVKATAPLPVIGNGDIHTPFQANERLKVSGCDAVMIGRGCLKNPWIFQESLALHKTGQLPFVEKNFTQVFDRLAYHLGRHYDDTRVTLHLKKFSAWFSAGYPGSANFRRDIFETKDLSAVVGTIQNYFGMLAQNERTDTSREAFLMGGHG